MTDPVKPTLGRASQPAALQPAAPSAAVARARAAALAAAAAPVPASAPMVDDTAESGVAGLAGSAGALLRRARQQQGLHIAALAAAIKVTPAKLESLEAGRYHELLDITFARSLAQAVCRVLKLDPLPVLALMPGVPSDALGPVDGGLKAPFRERLGRGMPGDLAPWRHPVLWLVVVLLLAAAAFVLVPSGALRDPVAPAGGGVGAPVMPPAGAASAGALVGAVGGAGAGTVLLPATPAETVAGTVADTVTTSLGVGAAPGAAAAPATLSASSNTEPGPANAADTVLLRALQASWVQAVDARGQVLMARTIPAGESIELTPAFPVKLRIGNAAGMELMHRGQPVNLKTMTRDNTVNITLP